MSSFEALQIDPRIMRVIEKMGWSEPTPVEEATIPVMMEGKDVMAQAQTGTGKTAAFGIPLLQKISKGRTPSALILVPTRELGVQVSEEITRLGEFMDLVTIPVYGGASIEVQFDQLRKGVDIVVGTPGRIIDHIRRGTLDLRNIKFLVLDEADRMLDMGFIDDIRYIISKLPKQRNTYLFSATLPGEIRDLAIEHMKEPQQINISEEKLVLPSTEQAYINVGRKNKIWALCRILDTEKPKAIVFCQTKRMVDILAKSLTSYGYPVAALHGDLTQARREKVLDDFRSGKIMVLIATDVAARGLDIEGVTHVINYDIPDNPEVYVHRIGRTGRAGKEGKAITFVTSQEEHLLKGIKDFSGAGVAHTEVPEGKGKETVRKVWDFDEVSDIFGMVKFRINLGRGDNMASADLSNLLTKRARISDFAIGHIEVGEQSSVIEVHKDVALKVINAVKGAEFRGKRLTFEPAKK
ncbi:MAG: DEAD/DEAH box helicase [Methanomassiliicoccales archaeon]|nr:DEAD/DEAH box helicase [Methanomassiliicoccales archaeon]MDD1755599.1 DEAD/DEAH box helicase [Methanomassiliicoccales archaeon]